MVVIGPVVGVYVIGLEPGLGDFSNEDCIIISKSKPLKIILVSKCHI